MKEAKEPVFVRLQSAALDDKNGEIVAHGWLDLAAIQGLRVGDYQREILESRGGRKSSLVKAIEASERLPDIMLGMRGQKYTERAGAMLLEDEVFIIDGLQRVSALRKYAVDHPDYAKDIRIGAEVRFGTTRDTEAALFTVLNVQRKAMSPSVILRNERNNSNGVATLYGLTMHDKNFAMLGKVCWDQQMHRGELMTALSFSKVCVTMHRSFAHGGRHLTAVAGIPKALDTMASAVGLQTFRHNISAFFEAVDAIWGIRGIKYTDRATHTRSNFLNELAGTISDHEDFWDGNKMVIDASQKAKLKSFPIDDPTIIRLSAAGASAGVLLRRHIIDHLNKNKSSSRHLTIKRVQEYKNRGHWRSGNHMGKNKKDEKDS